MVAALPEVEKNKLSQLEKIHPYRFGNLSKIWKNLLNKHFDFSPYSYIQNLNKAQNQGTLDIVKEIIDENKVPLSL